MLCIWTCQKHSQLLSTFEWQVGMVDDEEDADGDNDDDDHRDGQQAHT